MLDFFLRCISCSQRIRLSQDQSTLPLCQVCFESLISCPPLCRYCSSPICAQSGSQDSLKGSPHSTDGHCLRPWVQNEWIDSYSARYLLLSRGYPVLKKWKTSQGRLFDRQVLNLNSHLFSIWSEFGPQAIVPVPQAFSRAWKLQGSPTEKISSWIREVLKVPLIQLLLPPPSLKSRKRQAELSLNERLQTPLRFSLDSEQNLKNLSRVILVDDFMTSGRTVTQAAQVLKLAGVEKVHVFCLGIRPLKVVK